MSAQLAAALQRVATLRRRAEQSGLYSPDVLPEALSDIEAAVGRLKSVREELLAHRREVAALRASIDDVRRHQREFLAATSQAYLVTSPEADIFEVNPAASRLFNISQRFLIGRNLSIFICTDREEVIQRAIRLAEKGEHAEWVLQIRPRERAPLDVVCVVSASRPGAPVLRWLLRRPDSAAS